jgi:hypothetical protein
MDFSRERQMGKQKPKIAQIYSWQIAEHVHIHDLLHKQRGRTGFD